MARKHGSGNVEQRGSGWRWRLRVNGRLVCSRSYPTKEEAERVLVEAVRQIQSGDLLPAAGLTLRQWGARWLMTRDNRNHKTDAGRWQLHIEQSALASMPLKTITTKSIQLLLAQLQRTPSAKGGTLSVQTVRHCLNLLRSCMAAAAAEDLLATNPAEGLRVASPPSSTETWTYLTEAEIAAVMQLGEQPARIAYAVAIFAGLRQGELLGLHWQDVDLGARPQLTVRYSHGGPTKSGKIRRVPLLAPAYEALADLRKLSSGQGLVFPAPSGGRRGHGDDFGWATKKRGTQAAQLGHKEQCGITRPVRFHDLRHTCASHLIQGTWGAQWSLSEVAAMLGHSATKVTERYAHLSPDHLHRLAARTARTCPKRAQDLTGDDDDTDGAPDRNRTCGPRLRRPREVAADKGVSPVLCTDWAQVERAASETLLRLAAAGEAVPASVLDVLGVPDGEFQIRRGIERARAVLLGQQIIGAVLVG